MDQAMKQAGRPDPYIYADRWDIVAALAALLQSRVQEPGPGGAPKAPEEYLDEAVAVLILMQDMFPDVTPIDEETKRMHAYRETVKAVLEALHKEKQTRLRRE